MLLWINLLGRIFFHAALVGCFLRMLNVQKRLIIIWRKFIKAGRFSSRVKVFNVVNKTKGRMSKRVFQESKALQIFWKTNITYPLIRTRTCVSRKESTPNFPKNEHFLTPFVFLKHPFWDSSFCLITHVIWGILFQLCQDLTLNKRDGMKKVWLPINVKSDL